MHQILLSKYFREELQRRIWWRGPSPEAHIGSCLVTLSLPWTYLSLGASFLPEPLIVKAFFVIVNSLCPSIFYLLVLDLYSLSSRFFFFTFVTYSITSISFSVQKWNWHSFSTSIPWVKDKHHLQHSGEKVYPKWPKEKHSFPRGNRLLRKFTNLLSSLCLCLCFAESCRN